MRKLLPLLGIVSVLVAARSATAGVIYDNRGVSGIFTSSSGASIYFDDATATATAPFAINQIDFGYDNITAAPATFDLLVQFYDTVNYGAAFGVPVGTNPIGSLVDIVGLSVAAHSVDETGLINLLGSLPISTTGTFGYEYEFVKPGTTAFSEANIDSSIVPVFRNAPPIIGTSNPDFAYDYLNQSTIVGDATNGDVFTFNSPGANAYAAFGSTAVPEPASIALVMVGTVSVLSRRKRISQPAI